MTLLLKSNTLKQQAKAFLNKKLTTNKFKSKMINTVIMMLKESLISMVRCKTICEASKRKFKDYHLS